MEQPKATFRTLLRTIEALNCKAPWGLVVVPDGTMHFSGTGADGSPVRIFRVEDDNKPFAIALGAVLTQVSDLAEVLANPELNEIADDLLKRPMCEGGWMDFLQQCFAVKEHQELFHNFFAPAIPQIVVALEALKRKLVAEGWGPYVAPEIQPAKEPPPDVPTFDPGTRNA